MSNSKTNMSKPKNNWPSKVKGAVSGKKRDNNPPKPKSS
jgi:hypothetical protein